MNDRRTIHGCLTIAALLTGHAAVAETTVSADVTADGGYSSNPFALSGDNNGSAVFNAVFSPRISMAEATSTLNLSGQVSHIEYARLYGNQTNYTTRADFSKSLTAVSTLNLQAAFSSRVANAFGSFQDGGANSPTPSDPTVIEISGQRVKTIDGSASYTTALSSRGTLTVQAFGSRLESSDPLAIGNNYDSYGSTASYSHAVNARLKLGISGTFMRTDYVETQLGHANLISPAITGEFRITPRIKLSGNVGATISDVEQNGLAYKQTSFSGSADLCREGTRLTLCATASRSIRPTAISGISTVTSVTGSATYKLSPRSSVGGSLGYNRSRSLRDDILANLAQDIAIFTADANYNRTVTRRLSLQARVNYTDPYRSIGNRSANFTARVGVTYRLGRAQ